VECLSGTEVRRNRYFPSVTFLYVICYIIIAPCDSMYSIYEYTVLSCAFGFRSLIFPRIATRNNGTGIWYLTQRSLLLLWSVSVISDLYN
jgi:hypothetical protein